MLKEDLIRKLEEWGHSGWLRVGGNINGDWFSHLSNAISLHDALTRCYMIPDGYNIFGLFDGTWEAVSPVATPFAPTEDTAPRWFTHKDGFDDDTAFLEFKDGGYIIVGDDGSTSKLQKDDDYTNYTIEWALEAVASGTWIELKSRPSVPHPIEYWKAKDKRSRKRAWKAEQEVAQLKVDLDVESGLFNGTFAANTLLHKRIVELEGTLNETRKRLDKQKSMHAGTAERSRYYREQAEKMDVVIRGMRKCLSL